ncbi:hypothetical protein BGZ46_004872, partial [Entomortierella lignicola]
MHLDTTTITLTPPPWSPAKTKLQIKDSWISLLPKQRHSTPPLDENQDETPAPSQ